MALTARVSNMNGEIVAEKRDGQHRVLTSDPQGNVIDVRDSSGTQLASYNYWPYGGLRTSTGSLEVNPWRYSGAWGAYYDGPGFYMRARVFRTDLTRWMTVDSLWPSEWPYAYARVSPVSFVDPSGLQGWGVGDTRDDRRKLIEGNPVYMIVCGKTVPVGCHPPHACAGNECEYILQRSGVKAGTYCCDGKKFMCFRKGLHPEVRRCLKQHEDVHWRDLICGPCGLSSNHASDPIALKESECVGYVREIICLSAARARCKDDDCRTKTGSRLVEACEMLQFYHCKPSSRVSLEGSVVCAICDKVFVKVCKP